MKLYGAGTEKHLVDWQFITTKNADVLDPILDGYQQRIIKEYDDGPNDSTYFYIVKFCFSSNQKFSYCAWV